MMTKRNKPSKRVTPKPIKKGTSILKNAKKAKNQK
jgi:hypothetical protein